MPAYKHPPVPPQPSQPPSQPPSYVEPVQLRDLTYHNEATNAYRVLGLYRYLRADRPVVIPRWMLDRDCRPAGLLGFCHRGQGIDCGFSTSTPRQV